MKPNPSEVIIVGKWLLEGGKLVADANCRRIEKLIQSNFVKVSSSPDGWSTIYQDPGDSRYWELSYPQNELQGGGAPMLICVER
jgi:hypothetical protein